MNTRHARRLVLAFILGIAACLTTNSFAGRPLVLDSYGSFFIGGRNIQSNNLVRSGDPFGPPFLFPSGTIVVDQMYVQYKVPVGANRIPIILIHGCCLTGKSYETTPDGREGWEEYFLRQGHPVYVVDQPTRGRSGKDPSSNNRVAENQAPPSTLPFAKTAGREGAWTLFRFGPVYGQAYPGVQFPLEAADQFWAEIVQDYNSTTSAQGQPVLKDISLLAEKLGHAVVISHSQSAAFAQETAVFVNPKGIDGIVSVEGSCAFDNNAVNTLKNIPTMYLYGDNINGVDPLWTFLMQTCQTWAAQVNALGGNSSVVQTPDMGIRGTTHMMMLDKNNLEVASVIDTWIARNVERK